jgi:streptomycin 6-kinase
VDVPQVVRAKAGQAGADDWLAGLPELVAGLERDWGITVGRAYSDPTEAYVAEAELADGTLAVLKLLVPRTGQAADEITVLRLADGAGCVRLLASDADRSALLLDRLGPSLYELGVPIERRLGIMARSRPGCGARPRTRACKRARRRADGSPSTSSACGPTSAGRAPARQSTMR